jgi:hypothetical protein
MYQTTQGTSSDTEEYAFVQIWLTLANNIDNPLLPMLFIFKLLSSQASRFHISKNKNKNR